MRLSISSNPFGVVNCNENKSPQVVDLRIPLREPSPKRKAGLISPPCELANSSTTAAAAIVSERDPLSDSKQLHIEFIFLFGNNYFYILEVYWPSMRTMDVQNISGNIGDVEWVATAMEQTKFAALGGIQRKQSEKICSKSQFIP